ncbi:hypothetical protein ASA1KI_17040 [Opitutales bacterium ASA1]|uniref:chitobiase/beta-hexosaminidase C-terminal domain-containing protein n=1 Tax=Congregicoccus parvus TaxID=3081749 RepID=UPI002B2A8C51|nr:hypothetical protein ASA1KI_17040 [Opitutales bacterium ASA1]
MYSKNIPPLKTRARALQSGLALLALATTSATLVHGQNASSLVYTGSNGQLVYADYSGNGDNIPDYSGVGYMNSEVEIPFVPTVISISAGTGDRRADIQAAINALAAAETQANGFKGAIQFGPGTFQVSDGIEITTSGIVLRGAGSGENGTKLVFTKRAKEDFITFGPTGTVWTPNESSRRSVLGSYVPVGTKTFTVGSGHTFQEGDEVVLQYVYNSTWINMLEMGDAQWPGRTSSQKWSSSGSPTLNHERRVIATTGSTVTLDSPALDPFQPSWGTLSIVKIAGDSRIRNVGIENMFIEANPDRSQPNWTSTTLENHGWKAVNFEGVTNAWARDIGTRYFGYSCVSVTHRMATFITIEDCFSIEPWGQSTSGRRYTFNVQGHRVLVQRCTSDFGRHCFVSGSWTAGPVVFYDCHATDNRSDLGPHHRWSSGHLYDNVTTDNEIKVRNRGRTSTGSVHGWVGGQIMLWNCVADEIRVENPPGPNTNWAVGCVSPIIAGQSYPQYAGVFESNNAPITDIPSLFQAQLNERLGLSAPTFAPGQGAYTSAQSVAVTGDPLATGFRYTTNGTEPSATSGTVYSTGISVNSNTTLKAVAYSGALPASPVATAHYLVGTDAVSVDDAASFVNRALATSQTGVFAVEFDAVPTGNLDNGVVGLSFGASTAYSSMAVAVRFNPSGSIDARNGSAFAAATTINYSQNERYTFRLLVNVPAKTYSAYVTPFGGATQLIGANYAFRTEQSAVASLNTRSVRAQTGTLLVGPSQLIDSQVATPSISPFGGQFSGPQIVTLQSSTSGATIRYTTDGSFPTATSGTVYTSPFTVSTTTTVRAIATSPGLFDSNTTTAIFTITDTSYQVTQLNTFHNFPLGNTWTERFEAIFDVTPQGSDATVALSNGPSTGYAGLAAIVRFNTSNQIDVRNGGTYAADVAMPFTAGTTYRVRFWVDLPARTYSVFVQPSGGNEVRIANNYAFRTEQATVGALDNLNVETGAQPINVAQRMTQEWPKFWWTTTRTFDGVLPPIVNSTANGNAPQLTVAFWATPAQFAHMGVVDKMPAEGLVGWSVKFRDNGNVWFRVGSNTNRQDVVATAVYQPGTPVHFAATFDAGYVRIYRNGLEVAAQSVAYGVNENSVVLQVGKPSLVAVNDVYLGTLRDVRVYETPLTPAQIMTLAQP